MINPISLIPASISGPLVAGVMVVVLIIGAAMGIQIWWLKGELKDALKDKAQFESAYNLLAIKVGEQNAAINELGLRTQLAQEKYDKSARRNAKLKKELDDLQEAIRTHKYDPSKSACENAMDLIRSSKP